MPRTWRDVASGFVRGSIAGAFLCAIVLGIYFGVAYVGSNVLYNSPYNQADADHINEILDSKQKGNTVTVRGPVYGIENGYFYIWDNKPGNGGITIYHSGPISSEAVEVTGTTVYSHDGFGIEAQDVESIESQPYFKLPTFGSFDNNLRSAATIILAIALIFGAILGLLELNEKLHGY